MDDRIAKYAPILRAAFRAEGLPPEWGPAIARQESAFDPNAKVLTGGDGRRGGSYGLCQMSLLTAQGLGYRGDGEGLLEPFLNAKLAAKYCAQLVKQLKSNKLEDVAAAYNAGPGRVLSGKIPDSTKNHYVPRVLEFAALYGKESDAWR